MLKQYNEPNKMNLSDSNNHQKVLATSLREVNYFYPQTEVIIVIFKNLCSSQQFLQCKFFLLPSIIIMATANKLWKSETNKIQGCK